jgi:hypothetical protein
VLKSSRNILILLVILALAGLVGRRMWHVRPIIMAEIDADSPLSMPVQGALDHRFQFLSAWQSSQIPTARRFDPPLGSDHAGLSYNAQKFWDMNEKRHGHHSGDDLNGIGGMDTDLGDPVFSTADGLVLCAGDFSGGWGKLVVVAHTASDGQRLHAMYAMSRWAISFHAAAKSAPWERRTVITPHTFTLKCGPVTTSTSVLATA